MRLSIKSKQVAGVTVIVGAAVVLLSGWYLAQLETVLLEESAARAELLSSAVYQRTREVVSAAAPDNVRMAVQQDGGLRAILESAAAYSKGVTYAAIVGVDGVAIAHSDQLQIGQRLPAVEDLVALSHAGPIAQTRAIYTPGGKTFDLKTPLLLNGNEFGSIRIGISTLLIRTDFNDALRTPVYTALIALAAATIVAMLLAQVMLRPIHVIRSGLARLGRGELDVNVELPHDPSLGELGDSFKAVSARLAADRTQLAGQRAALESVVEHLEDAVALFSPDGALLFANPAMRAALGDAAGPVQALPAAHPYRSVVEETLQSHDARGPLTVHLHEAGERLVHTHPVTDADGRLIGVMLVARNLAYLTEVEYTLNYSHKLAALGRLSAGIAHEVKNPLNATMIHLELLKMKLADHADAGEHLTVIAQQVRRLDQVVQGFLKFTRPEDLKLQAVALGPLLDQMLPVVRAEAEAVSIEVTVECPPDLPEVRADPGMLEQALLNLALNACQAMPQGGRLRIAASVRPGRRVAIAVEDTGVGIEPKNLERIFDLYFTTKAQGSGIGLSMVYRIVQLHDGDIEVQSIPGHGTTFTVTLRQS